MSNSPFSSPALMVKKKEEGAWRLVIDFRHVNALTVKSKYPIHIIDELLDDYANVISFFCHAVSQGVSCSYKC